MLSAPAKHAIRALLYMTEVEADVFVSVSELAEKADIPSPFLAKVVKSLAISEIVETRKGPNGGVRLRKMQTTFYEICAALSDPIIVEKCLLSNFQCSDKHPCPFHDAWSVERTRIISYLKKSKIRKRR